MGNFFYSTLKTAVKHIRFYKVEVIVEEVSAMTKGVL